MIVVSGHATVHDAVNAIKLGATDFFEKPLNRERVLVSVRNSIRTARLSRTVEQMRGELEVRYEMIGTSAPIQKLFQDIDKVAPTKASVLITGESSTGKELVSRAIHRLSPRKDAPFVAEAFVSGFCKENGLRSKKIDPSEFDTLARRKWPGNVRELKNVVERAAILSSDVITVADLPEDPHESPFDDEGEDTGASSGPADSMNEAESTPLPSAPSDRLTLREYRESTERAYIIDTLKALEWNISKAASILGVERTNLHKKVRSYGIKRGEG